MSFIGQPVNRQAIKNALFVLGQNAVFANMVNNVTTWNYTSRRLKTFANIDPSQMPAMFLVQHKEGYEAKGVARLTRRYLDMGFWCYADSAAEGVIGDDYLDSMESALEQALMPDDNGRQELTLNGLAYWVRITRQDGLFIRDPGDLDGNALLVLPVRILLP
jgi:hypothetical protein